MSVEWRPDSSQVELYTRIKYDFAANRTLPRSQIRRRNWYHVKHFPCGKLAVIAALHMPHLLFCLASVSTLHCLQASGYQWVISCMQLSSKYIMFVGSTCHEDQSLAGCWGALDRCLYRSGAAIIPLPILDRCSRKNNIPRMPELSSLRGKATRTSFTIP